MEAGMIETTDKAFDHVLQKKTVFHEGLWLKSLTNPAWCSLARHTSHGCSTSIHHLKLKEEKAVCPAAVAVIWQGRTGNRGAPAFTK